MNQMSDLRNTMPSITSTQRIRKWHWFCTTPKRSP